MIKVQISKSTSKVIHIDTDGKKTVITELPPRASLRAIKARIKVMGLRSK